MMELKKMEETEAYITAKDYKEGFPHKFSFCFTNLSKSDIGKISKNQLDKINKILIPNTNVNQWKNTTTVIDWFKNVASKKQCSFIQFDVESFYPSISLNFFSDGIQYVSTIRKISDSNNTIVKHSRKTLLFHNN